MTKEEKYGGIILGVLLTVLGLGITIGGDFYSSKYERVIDFLGLHVPFGLFTAGVGIFWVIVSFRKRKKGVSSDK